MAAISIGLLKGCKNINDMNGITKQFAIANATSNFEREKLRYPFGFKGGYLTELWQVVTRLKSPNGVIGVGLATQSVLYGDANVFASNSEAGGNALMYVLVNKALDMLVGHSFKNPIEAVTSILSEVYDEGKRLTGQADLNINFVYNALVSVDNALWMLYAKEQGATHFLEILPSEYKIAFSNRTDKVAVMYQIPYGMALSSIRQAAEEGYFIFKIKTGQLGTEEEMLQKDKNRLFAIHNILKSVKTSRTTTGKVYYTMDANGRYNHKSSLRFFLDYAKEIGAFEHILLYEEPFSGKNEEDVSDLGVIIAADESVHSVDDARKKIKLGYGAFALKPIAKTLSETLKIIKVAYDHGIPCFCADLTVNPILVDWNKHVAASLPPFPELGMGMMETNGDMNYTNWLAMKDRHPYADAGWTQVTAGVFELDNQFFAVSGGILTSPPFYEQLAEGNQ